MDLKKYGYFTEQMPQDGEVARVTAVHRDRYEIIADGYEGLAVLSAALLHNNILSGNSEGMPTVGDFVVVSHTDAEGMQIERVLERRTCFKRLDTWQGEVQLVAANFDYVFILQSLNRDFNLPRLERYLVLAHQSGAKPVVVLTKADLAQDFTKVECAARSVAETVVAVSVVTGAGLELLMPYFAQGITVVFLGSSGVGKSSLVNALAGSRLMATNEVRASDDRGRHTTTHRQLLFFQSGAMVIDTPGMREMGLWDARQGIQQQFAGVEEYAALCRFRNCRHYTEPDCAVRAAVQAGKLQAQQVERYRKLLKENKTPDQKKNMVPYDPLLERKKHKSARKQQRRKPQEE